MPLKHYTHWIFDMDGTLTMAVHDFEKIRQQIGVAPGVPILEAIAQMPEPQASQVNQHLHDLEMDLAYQARPQPGAENVLQRLIDNGKQLGILTRNGEEIAHATLKSAGLSDYFSMETIIGRESCPPKPLPDGVHLLLDLWGADKQATVIVGDYLYDIQAGFDAGIKTVHYDHTGVFAWPQYTHHRITEIAQLQEMI